jgi:hypothetical protein
VLQKRQQVVFSASSSQHLQGLLVKANRLPSGDRADHMHQSLSVLCVSFFESCLYYDPKDILKVLVVAEVLQFRLEVGAPLDRLLLFVQLAQAAVDQLVGSSSFLFVGVLVGFIRTEELTNVS